MTLIVTLSGCLSGQGSSALVTVMDPKLDALNEALITPNLDLIRAAGLDALATWDAATEVLR